MKNGSFFNSNSNSMNDYQFKKRQARADVLTRSIGALLLVVLIFQVIIGILTRM